MKFENTQSGHKSGNGHIKSSSDLAHVEAPRRVVVVVVVRKSTHTIPYRLYESTAYHKGGVVAKEPPGHMDTHIGETRTLWLSVGGSHVQSRGLESRSQ